MASGDDRNPSTLSLGSYPAAGVGIGLLIGTWLDHRFGWGSKGLIIGAVIGMISGLYLLIKEGTKTGKK
jgi:F0F1-type ATP synthase assembly protein I